MVMCVPRKCFATAQNMYIFNSILLYHDAAAFY